MKRIFQEKKKKNLNKKKKKNNNNNNKIKKTPKDLIWLCYGKLPWVIQGWTGLVYEPVKNYSPSGSQWL